MAMATGKTLDYVYGSVGHDGSEIIPAGLHPDKRRGFNLEEAVIYFAKHGIYFGHVLLFDEGIRMTSEHRIAPEIKPTDGPAILDVVSETLPEPCLHTVFWDAEALVVRDPNPRVPNTRDLEEFVIKGWWNLTAF
jgi:hypothetical protein